MSRYKFQCDWRTARSGFWLTRCPWYTDSDERLNFWLPMSLCVFNQQFARYDLPLMSERDWHYFLVFLLIECKQTWMSLNILLKFLSTASTEYFGGKCDLATWVRERTVRDKQLLYESYMGLTTAKHYALQKMLEWHHRGKVYGWERSQEHGGTKPFVRVLWYPRQFKYHICKCLKTEKSLRWEKKLAEIGFWMKIGKAPERSRMGIIKALIQKSVLERIEKCLAFQLLDTLSCTSWTSTAPGSKGKSTNPVLLDVIKASVFKSFMEFSAREGPATTFQK